jgi:hypothetical protein
MNEKLMDERSDDNHLFWRERIMSEINSACSKETSVTYNKTSHF